MRFYEHSKRSIVKALTYRVLIVITNSLAVYFFTRSVKISIGMAVVNATLGTTIYYFHERIWNRIHWGKAKA